jgi:hypothetical protein
LGVLYESLAEMHIAQLQLLDLNMTESHGEVWLSEESMIDQ